MLSPVFGKFFDMWRSKVSDLFLCYPQWYMYSNCTKDMVYPSTSGYYNFFTTKSTTWCVYLNGKNLH